MRTGSFVLVGVLLTACAPQVPDSGAGVGFEDYGSYQQQRIQRDRQLAGETTVRAPQGQATVSPQQIAGPPESAEVDIARVAGAAIDASEGTGAPAPVVTTNNPGISDEQDFSAVSERETIQSDRQRLQAQRQTYEVIAPTAVPTRQGGSGVNIVDFALSTNNQPGQQAYRRSGLRGDPARSCAKYTSSDLAQEAFLKAGGPEKDKLNLDPDGDGFACGWDPRPFRLAVNR